MQGNKVRREAESGKGVRNSTLKDLDATLKHSRALRTQRRPGRTAVDQGVLLMGGMAAQRLRTSWGVQPLRTNPRAGAPSWCPWVNHVTALSFAVLSCEMGKVVIKNT